MKSVIWIVFSIGLFSACQHSFERGQLGSTRSLEDEMNELLSWFPGEYDNSDQVQNERALDVPDSLQHRHTHHLFQPVSITGITGQLLYAQQYQHYDPKDIYRQRIYSFSIDLAEEAIRLTIYTPNDPDALVDLHVRPDLQNKLRQSDFYLKPGCEVYWKKRGDEFYGYLKENACSYFSDRFGKRVFLNETLILRKNALILDDRAVDEDGNLVFGVDDKGPTINKKVG